MNDDNLKNLWNQINDQSEFPEFEAKTNDQFITNRSGSILNKVRNILQHDLILKSISGVALLLTLAFYQDTPDVVYISIAGILFLILMTYLEVRTLKQFNKISDPTQSIRDNLSGIQIFLKRNSSLVALINASSQILIFVPGLLLYFYMAYGQVKPVNTFSFFVFSGLCLIGIITSYLRITSLLKFHIKNISVFLSDLNNNVLAFVSQSIEKQRKQDEKVRLLVGFLLIFAFTLFVLVLRSIIG